MPEQLTKHPGVTLEVLRSTGAKCGGGAAPEILTHCPADRFCKLPGGELCVYGLADAGQMTQITAAEWQTLAPAPAVPPPTASPGGLVGVVLASALPALLVGAAAGALFARRRRA